MDKKFTTILNSEGLNHGITYSIRTVFGVSFLLINSNFDPMDFPKFIELEMLKCEGIKQLDAVGVYDDGSGYMIYLLHKGFDNETLSKEIKTTFKNFFNKQP